MACADRPDNQSAVDKSAREVVSVFTDQDQLEDAIEDLYLAGFDRNQVHLLASCRTVEAKLGHMIGNVRELEDEPDLPAENYADRHERAEGAAVGAAVATGGTLAVIIAAAVAAGSLSGGVGALLVRALGKYRVRQVKEQLHRGGLLLWVELCNPEQEQKALAILQRHSGEDVHIHELTRA